MTSSSSYRPCLITLAALLMAAPVLLADNPASIPQYSLYLKYTTSGPLLDKFGQPQSADELLPNSTTSGGISPHGYEVSAKVLHVDQTGFNVRIDATAEDQSKTVTVLIPYDQKKTISLLPHLSCTAAVADSSKSHFDVLTPAAATARLKDTCTAASSIAGDLGKPGSVATPPSDDPASTAAYFAGYATGKDTALLILYTPRAKLPQARILAEQLLGYQVYADLCITDTPTPVKNAAALTPGTRNLAAAQNPGFHKVVQRIPVKLLYQRDLLNPPISKSLITPAPLAPADPFSEKLSLEISPISNLR